MVRSRQASSIACCELSASIPTETIGDTPAASRLLQQLARPVVAELVEVRVAVR